MFYVDGSPFWFLCMVLQPKFHWCVFTFQLLASGQIAVVKCTDAVVNVCFGFWEEKNSLNNFHAFACDIEFDCVELLSV